VAAGNGAKPFAASSNARTSSTSVVELVNMGHASSPEGEELSDLFLPTRNW
jgi:hypothetical protein